MKILHLIKDEDNDKRGWLFIKAHYLKLDIQQHIVLGTLIYALSFFLLCLTSEIKDLKVISETSLLIAFFVGFGKEVSDLAGLTKFIYKKIFKKDITRTMFNFIDVIATVFISGIIHLIMCI